MMMMLLLLHLCMYAKRFLLFRARYHEYIIFIFAAPSSSSPPYM